MSFSWQDIWRLVKRWWWLAIIGVVLAGGTSYYFASKKPSIYSARTRLMVGSGIRSADPNSRDFGLSVTLAQVYGEMARLRPVTQGVVDRLELPISWRDLAWRIQTRVIPSAQLLEIIVYDTNPDSAALLANEVAEELIRQSPAMSQKGVDRDFVLQEMADTQKKMEDAQAQIDELRDSMLELKSATELEDARTQLNELEQLKSSFRSVYVELASVLNTQSPNTLTVVEPASPSWSRVAPNPKKDAMMAAAAGLALAIAAVVALEFLDDTLRIHDIDPESVLGQPVLGTVPRMSGGRCEPRSPAAEMIRQLRTKVLLSSSQSRLKSLVVTSPSAKDGKSVVTANLAITLATGGVRSVLIDADLRAPSLHEWLDQPNLAGLTDLLNADKATCQALLPQVLRDTDVAGLSFISAGRPPLDPSILLASPRLTELLTTLSEQFDFVLFDSPPVLVAPDAPILATVAEGSLLVISPGRTGRRATTRAIDELQSRKATHLIGIALNRASLSHYAYRYTHQETLGLQRRRLAQLWHRLKSSNALSSVPWIGKPPAPDLLSVSEAARALGVRRKTVKRWCQEGRLSGVKQRLRWWVKADGLERLLRQPTNKFGVNQDVESALDVPSVDGTNGRSTTKDSEPSTSSSAQEPPLAAPEKQAFEEIG